MSGWRRKKRFLGFLVPFAPIRHVFFFRAFVSFSLVRLCLFRVVRCFRESLHVDRKKCLKNVREKKTQLKRAFKQQEQHDNRVNNNDKNEISLSLSLSLIAFLSFSQSFRRRRRVLFVFALKTRRRQRLLLFCETTTTTTPQKRSHTQTHAKA